jgi:hypothetical protein
MLIWVLFDGYISIGGLLKKSLVKLGNILFSINTFYLNNKYKLFISKKLELVKDLWIKS